MKKFTTTLNKSICVQRFKSQPAKIYKGVGKERVWIFKEKKNGNLVVSTKNISWSYKGINNCYMKIVCEILEKEKTTINISTKFQKNDLIPMIIFALFIVVRSKFYSTAVIVALFMVVLSSIIFYTIASSREENELEIIEHLKLLFGMKEET